MKTQLDIYREIPKDRYLEKIDMKKIILSILDNDIERQEEQIKIHTHLIEDYEQSPKEWHRGRVQSAKDNITYLKEQRNLIANEK